MDIFPDFDDYLATSIITPTPERHTCAAKRAGTGMACLVSGIAPNGHTKVYV
eukprot:CAMPEP_0183298148 /NCGR_PEP_ID=MMETSP0160_2-20130417/5258_1 /TAXON_ID=2839 ORGANISM="Odontella Sinensis, Strain Grunow 1884" /NCGR_SAMPLE_ID=MMETSP0160_2 /ASSEMBLY_ACC=CAM_ASM_000250 /LENGTH=51 /DNA_ID=CAMNT_0025460117 /DNA_START=440 /DNA_END=592 /DNA_ORIENTATION=-